MIAPLNEFVEAVGVKMAVQTLESVLDWVKLVNKPPVTEILLESKLPAFGAEEKVKVIVAESPTLKKAWLLVIETPGAVAAVKDNEEAVPKLPERS